MASASFHDSLNSLGWSRRGETSAPAQSNTSTPFFSKIQSWNPLGSGRGGYVQLSPDNAASSAPLPAPSRREEEEAWFARECRPPTHTLPISPFLISLICSYRIRIHTRTHPHHFYILFILTSPKRENPSCDILACYFTLSHAVLSLHPFPLFFFFPSLLSRLCFLFPSSLERRAVLGPSRSFALPLTLFLRSFSQKLSCPPSNRTAPHLWYPKRQALTMDPIL